MLLHIQNSDDAQLCRRILAVIFTVYRPITLSELASVVNMPVCADDVESLEQIVALCGSLLTVRDSTVYFVHLSAKDFLLGQALSNLFLCNRDI
jgi:hypothetical protein